MTKSAELLTVKEASDFLKLSETTLNRYRTYGGGPRYRKLGRNVRYIKDDLLDWANQRDFSSTSEYVA